MTERREIDNSPSNQHNPHVFLLFPMEIVYVLQKEQAGDFSIYSPQFPVSSCGVTKEEAIRNFQEAMELYTEEMGGKKSIGNSSSEFGKVMIHA